MGLVIIQYLSWIIGEESTQALQRYKRIWWKCWALEYQQSKKPKWLWRQKCNVITHCLLYYHWWFWKIWCFHRAIFSTKAAWGNELERVLSSSINVPRDEMIIKENVHISLNIYLPYVLFEMWQSNIWQDWQMRNVVYISASSRSIEICGQSFYLFSSFA